MVIADNKVCTHSNTVLNADSFEVCADCGLILDESRLWSDPHADMLENLLRNKNLRAEGMEIMSSLTQVGQLGSEIRFEKGNTIRDYAGHPIAKSETTICFSRTRQMAHSLRFRGVESLYQNFKILSEIGGDLQLPYYVREDVALRYRKLFSRDERIRNRLTALCYCVWDAMRAHKTPIPLNEVLNAFRARGHRVGTRLLVQDGLEYSEWLKQAGISKTLPKTPRDYINRHIGNIASDVEFQKRFRDKKPSENIDEFVAQLRNKCFEILEKVKPVLEYYSRDPSHVSASCIYFAKVLLVTKSNEKYIFNQKMLSKATGVPEYSLRDIYISFFKAIQEKRPLRLLRGVATENAQFALLGKSSSISKKINEVIKMESKIEPKQLNYEPCPDCKNVVVIECETSIIDHKKSCRCRNRARRGDLKAMLDEYLNQTKLKAFSFVNVVEALKIETKTDRALLSFRFHSYKQEKRIIRIGFAKGKGHTGIYIAKEALDAGLSIESLIQTYTQPEIKKSKYQDLKERIIAFLKTKSSAQYGAIADAIGITTKGDRRYLSTILGLGIAEGLFVKIDTIGVQGVYALAESSETKSINSAKELGDDPLVLKIKELSAMALTYQELALNPKETTVKDLLERMERKPLNGDLFLWLKIIPDELYQCFNGNRLKKIIEAHRDG